MTTSHVDELGECDVCGGGPTAFGTFKSVIVILIGLSVRTRLGDFCRDCGLAVFRAEQKFTLVAGWWGLPALAGLIVLLMNLKQVARFEQLPAAEDRVRAPLPPGRPVSQSPALIVPFLFVALLTAFCCF